MSTPERPSDQQLLAIAYDNMHNNQLSTGDGANQDGVSPKVAHDLGFILPEEVAEHITHGPHSPAMLAVRAQLARVQPLVPQASVEREERIMAKQRARVREEIARNR